MYILGIETSTAVCATAIIKDHGLVAEYRLHCKNCHSEKLAATIERLSHDSRVDLREVDGIAVSIGPGSFTGLRIGLSVAKGLAYSLEVPLVDVPTLDALAFQLPSTPYLVCPILKARRNEVYTAFYRNQGGSLKREGQYRILPLEGLLEEISEKTVFLGDGVEWYGNSIEEKLGEKAIFTAGICTFASGVSVAQLGLEKLKRGLQAEVENLEPLYLREFPIKN